MDRNTFLSRAATTIDITLDDGSVVKARKLSAAEVEHLTKKYGGNDKNQLEGLRYVVSRCVVDAEGERVFKDEDKEAMLKVDYDSIQHIAAEVVEFSGLNKHAKKA